MQSTRLIIVTSGTSCHGGRPVRTFSAYLGGAPNRKKVGGSPEEAIGRLMIEAPEFLLPTKPTGALLSEPVEDLGEPLDEEMIASCADALGRLALLFPDVYGVAIVGPDVDLIAV